MLCSRTSTVLLCQAWHWFSRLNKRNLGMSVWQHLNCVCVLLWAQRSEIGYDYPTTSWMPSAKLVKCHLVNTGEMVLGVCMKWKGMCHATATCVHLCVLARDTVLAAKLCQSFTKFSLLVLYEELSSKSVFCENQFSDGCVLLEGVHEFLPLCSISFWPI
jgi:hypothetical protein